MRRRDDFMQGGAGEPAPRQTEIKRAKAEGQDFVRNCCFRQQPAQFLHDSGVFSRRGRDDGRRNLGHGQL